MKTFEYEWWTVKIKIPVGIHTWEFQGKSKAHVIKQIEKAIRQGEKDKANNVSDLNRAPEIIEVYWDTLTLDRKGYKRRF